MALHVMVFGMKFVGCILMWCTFLFATLEAFASKSDEPLSLEEAPPGMVIIYYRTENGSERGGFSGILYHDRIITTSHFSNGLMLRQEGFEILAIHNGEGDYLPMETITGWKRIKDYDAGVFSLNKALGHPDVVLFDGKTAPPKGGTYQSWGFGRNNSEEPGTLHGFSAKNLELKNYPGELPSMPRHNVWINTDKNNYIDFGDSGGVLVYRAHGKFSIIGVASNSEAETGHSLYEPVANVANRIHSNDKFQPVKYSGDPSAQSGSLIVEAHLTIELQTDIDSIFGSPPKKPRQPITRNSRIQPKNCSDELGNLMNR